MARGHEVTLAAPSVYAAKVVAAGVPFAQLGPTFAPAYVTELMQSAIELRDPIAQIQKVFAEGVCRGAEETYGHAKALVEASDLVVTNITGAPAMAAAEAVGRPLLTGVLNHGLVPSRHHHFPGLPSFWLLDPLAWRLGSWLVSRSVDPLFNVYRRLAGLEPAFGFTWGRIFSETANLIPISPALAPRRPDWPAHHHVTGYWFLEEPDAPPPPELAAFLEAGEPPLLVSFGSNTEKDAAAMSALLVEAVKASGQRALLQDGWAGLGGVELPPTMLRIGWAPYAWLLQRVSGVVHHAGSGTTAHVLRAGKPSVGIPKGFDQPFWGEELERTRTGICLPHRKLTAKRLAAAITKALGSAELKQNAARMGEAIRAEDGVARGCEVVEKIAKG